MKSRAHSRYQRVRSTFYRTRTPTRVASVGDSRNSVACRGRQLVEPVAPRVVMRGRARPAERNEVIEDDRAGRPRASRRSGPAAGRLPAACPCPAIEHEQIEGPVLPELGPVAFDDANVRLPGEQRGRRRRPAGIALNAHDRGGLVGGAEHPRQPDSASGPGLADPSADVARGQHRQQRALSHDRTNSRSCGSVATSTAAATSGGRSVMPAYASVSSDCHAHSMTLGASRRRCPYPPSAASCAAVRSATAIASIWATVMFA